MGDEDDTDQSYSQYLEDRELEIAQLEQQAENIKNDMKTNWKNDTIDQVVEFKMRMVHLHDDYAIHKLGDSAIGQSFRDANGRDPDWNRAKKKCIEDLSASLDEKDE